MKIAVVGAGGVGGYYGGLLAKSGQDVTFIARGEHLKTIQRKGLTVKAVTGDFTIQVKATDDYRGLGTFDLILICVKAYDTEQAVRQIIPLLKEDTVVISLQNGIEKEEVISSFVGGRRVLGGALYIESAITEPGVVHQISGPRRIVFGELNGAITERAKRIYEVFRAAGIICELSSNIKRELWEKFVWICGGAGVTSVTRLSLGPILRTSETRDMFVDAMKEVEALARASSVTFVDDVVSKILSLAESLPSDFKTSMQRDLEQGRRLEVDALNGAVARLGEKLNVPTPVNRFIYACLKPWDIKARTSLPS